MLVALVAIIVLSVTAASAANYLVGGMESDGHGSYASVMTGVANGGVDFSSLSQGVSVDSGVASAGQDSVAYGDGVVQQSATGNLYRGISSLSATYTTRGSANVEQTSDVSTSGAGPVADAYQSSSGYGRSIFSVVGTSSGQTDFSSAYVVVKDGYTADPVMTAHLDDLGTSSTIGAYSPNGLIGVGAGGDLVSAGTVSNYGIASGATNALVTNGVMTTAQMSGAGADTIVGYGATLDDPQDSVGISFVGGAVAEQTTTTSGETNLVSSVANVASRAGTDTASASASSGSWYLVGQVDGQNVYSYQPGTVSTTQVAAATIGESASFQTATDVTGSAATATTNAHDTSGNTATSSVTSTVGKVTAFQASYEGTNYANSLQDAYGYGPLVEAKTCAVDALGANANTDMKVSSGVLNSAAFSKAFWMSSEAQQQGANAGTDGSATTYARADGAAGNTVTSYQDEGSLSVEGSGSAAVAVPGLKSAAAWQQGVEVSGTNPYTNEHSTVGFGYYTAGASNANAQADSGTLNVGFAGTSSTDSFLGVNSAATQSGVTTTDGVDAQASTSVIARYHVTAGTFDSVTDGKLAVGTSGSVVNDFNNGYHNAAAGQSGVAIDGTNVVAASNANTPQFSGTQVTGVDDGKVLIYGGQGAYADNYQGAASASGVVVTGDPGHVTSVASGAGNNAVANAAFTAGAISLTGNQQAQATGSGADASQSGVDVAGVNAVASTNAYNWMNGASATGYTTFGGVSVDGTQSAGVSHTGAGAGQSDVSVGGVNAVASTNAHNWMYDSSATGSATFGGVDVDGYQTAGVSNWGAGASQSDVSAGGVNAVVSTNANSWANGASATGSATFGGVDAGYQTAEVTHSGAGASQSDVSAGGVNAVVSTDAHNWVYDASATGSATFGGVDAGYQSAGVSNWGAGASQSDVTAGGVNAVASTNAHSSVFDATTTGSALFGGVNVDGSQQASVNGYEANANQHDVSAFGVNAVTTTNANSNRYDATSTAASLLGSASVDGYQSAGVSYSGAGASQHDVAADGIGVVTSTNAHSSAFDATAHGNANLGSATVYGQQTASVNFGSASAGNDGTTASGFGVDVRATAVSDDFSASAFGSADVGSATAWDDQTASVNYGGANAGNSGTSASGFNAAVGTTASESTHQASSVDTAAAGSVTVYGYQGASSVTGSAIAGQNGAELNGAGLLAKTSASGPTYSASTSATSDWGSVSIGSSSQRAEAGLFASANQDHVVASGIDPTLTTVATGNGNNAVANANIATGVVSGRQAANVWNTGAQTGQDVYEAGFGYGSATVSVDTPLADSAAKADFVTNGGYGQHLSASQGATATTDLQTGVRTAASGQNDNIDGLSGSASSSSSTSSPAPFGPFSTSATTSADFSDDGSLAGSQSTNVGVYGWFGQQNANAGQSVSLTGMDLDADTSVSTGLANADTSADADGYRFDYGPVHVYNPASLSATQSATSSTNVQTFSRGASAGQTVAATGMEASTETNADAGILLDASATAGFHHGIVLPNVGNYDAGTMTDTQSAGASAGHLGIFDRTASASNTNLNIQTYHPNGLGGYATTSATTGLLESASTTASYIQGSSTSGISETQSSTVNPYHSQAVQTGVIKGTLPEATSVAQHGLWPEIKFNSKLWGTLNVNQNAYRS